MKRIVAVTVTYDDDSTKSFEGAGTVDEFATEQHVGNKAIPVQFITATLQTSPVRPREVPVVLTIP